jgi:glutamate-1-semialdehyde aminotransferase
MKATLEKVLTDKMYERANMLAQKFVDGVEEVIKENGLPWHINILGCRAGKYVGARLINPS